MYLNGLHEKLFCLFHLGLFKTLKATLQIYRTEGIVKRVWRNLKFRNLKDPSLRSG